MPMEGLAQLGKKRMQGRPAPQTPCRTQPGSQSQAATKLSTPSSDPEPQEHLPLRQQEDLEPSMAEHRGEEAGDVHVSVWEEGAELHRKESHRAGSGPGTNVGLTSPIFYTAVRVHPMLGILCDSLGSFLSPYTHIKMLVMGNLLFSHSSSTGLSLQPDSTSKSCPYISGCYRSRTQGSTEGRSRPDTSLPKDTRPAGYWPAHWAYCTSVPAGPPATGTDVPPPQREHPPPPPPAPVPARALAGDPEAGDESPPLQGEPALPPAQDPDAHDD